MRNGTAADSAEVQTPAEPNSAVSAPSTGTLPPKRRPQSWQTFRTVGDCRRALRWVFGQVKDKGLDPKAANTLTFIACSIMKAIELEDLEARILALEAEQQDQADRSFHITVKGRPDAVI